MRSYFICIQCACAIDRILTEYHFKKCFNPNDQLDKLLHLKYGIADWVNNSLVLKGSLDEIVSQ